MASIGSIHPLAVTDIVPKPEPTIHSQSTETTTLFTLTASHALVQPGKIAALPT